MPKMAVRAKTKRAVLRSLILASVCSLLLTAYLYRQFGPYIRDRGQEWFTTRPGRDIKLNSTISVRPEVQVPLRTNGSRILDARNSTVRLTTINWYGSSDLDFVPAGLDVRHRRDIAILIRRLGFNSVRLPYSDEMVRDNPAIPQQRLAANPDLVGQTALAVYHQVVHSLTEAGLLVIPNNHITQATWCCGANLCDAQWANDWLGPICRVRQTEADWISNWEKVMGPLASNELVIGADLRNEVRAPWGTLRWETWAAAAERAAERLLAINSTWLMIVEGLSSANDLSGVRERPVRLSVPDRVVYSAHVYGWSGWGELAPYTDTTYERFSERMRANWAYLLEEDLAPVWVGEMGAPDLPSQGDLNYWTHLVRFLEEQHAAWGYWAVNPRKPADNEYERYGLVRDDWETVRWDYRLNSLVKLGLGRPKEAPRDGDINGGNNDRNNTTTNSTISNADSSSGSDKGASRGSGAGGEPHEEKKTHKPQDPVQQGRFQDEQIHIHDGDPGLLERPSALWSSDGERDGARGGGSGDHEMEPELKRKMKRN